MLRGVCRGGEVHEELDAMEVASKYQAQKVGYQESATVLGHGAGGSSFHKTQKAVVR